MSVRPTESSDDARLLILGLGNVLCGDDGLGIVAIDRLQRDYRIPSDVQVVDGGTLGLALLHVLEDAETVLLVDAVRTGESPGSLVRMDGEEVAPAVRERLSPHQVGVADLLDALRLLDRYPSRLMLLGLVPETLLLGLDRSAPVEAALPLLIQAIVDTTKELGFELEVRSSGPTRPTDRTGPTNDEQGADTRAVSRGVGVGM